MLFKMQVTDGNQAWWEEMDVDAKDAQKCAEEIIKNFNGSLKRKEKRRELLAVEMIKADTKKKHNWEKQNSFTIIQDRQSYDILRCSGCGITAKRFGLDTIVFDLDYKWAQVYKRCDTAKAHIEKKKLRKKKQK